METVPRRMQRMDRDPLLSRITLDPRIMVGQPVVCGTRLTVSFIVGRLAHGSAVEELLSEYGGLTREDVQACLLFAAETVADNTFAPLANAK